MLIKSARVNFRLCRIGCRQGYMSGIVLCSTSLPNLILRLNTSPHLPLFSQKPVSLRVKFNLMA